MPLLRHTSAMTGAAPVPVPPPMPAVMNTMCDDAITLAISSLLSSAASRLHTTASSSQWRKRAYFVRWQSTHPTFGFAPAPRPSVTPLPSCRVVGAIIIDRCCASVLAHMKSTPESPFFIILFTALHPPPPTPITDIRGLNSFKVGLCTGAASGTCAAAALWGWWCVLVEGVGCSCAFDLECCFGWSELEEETTTVGGIVAWGNASPFTDRRSACCNEVPSLLNARFWIGIIPRET